jgi:hypothetical protein
MLQEKRTAAPEMGRLGRGVAEAGAWGNRCCRRNEWRGDLVMLDERDIVSGARLL